MKGKWWNKMMRNKIRWSATMCNHWLLRARRTAEKEVRSANKKTTDWEWVHCVLPLCITKATDQLELHYVPPTTGDQPELGSNGNYKFNYQEDSPRGITGRNARSYQTIGGHAHELCRWIQQTNQALTGWSLHSVTEVTSGCLLFKLPPTWVTSSSFSTYSGCSSSCSIFHLATIKATRRY